MALSQIIDGTTEAHEFTGTNHLGPFLDGNGNIYVISWQQGSSTTIHAWKSTDGGATWARIDTANAPSIEPKQSLAAILDGTRIHVATHGTFPGGKTQNVVVQYHAFDTSDAATNADTWTTVRNSIGTFDVGDDADVTEVAGMAIAVRSDGDVIVIHPGSTFTDMGTDYFQLSYSRREGGSWTTDIALNANAANQAYPRMVMAPNDECHMFYYGVSTSLFGQTLDSANSMSTRVTIAGGPTAARRTARPIYFNDAGSDKVLVLFGNQNIVRVRRCQEDGNGDIDIDGVVTDIDDAATIFNTYNSALAWDSVNGVAYALWDDPQNDLTSDSSPNASDGGWGTDVELEDNVAVVSCWANYYDRSGPKLAYVIYETANGLSYGELSLAAASLVVPRQHSIRHLLGR